MRVAVYVVPEPVKLESVTPSVTVTSSDVKSLGRLARRKRQIYAGIILQGKAADSGSWDKSFYGKTLFPSSILVCCVAPKTAIVIAWITTIVVITKTRIRIIVSFSLSVGRLFLIFLIFHFLKNRLQVLDEYFRRGEPRLDGGGTERDRIAS